MVKKIIGFICCVVLIACITAATVQANPGFDLGEFTIGSEVNTQKGWCTNGVDGIETDLTIEHLRVTESFVFYFDTEIENMIFVCLGDGNDWSWTETPINTSDSYFCIDVNDINGWSEVMKGDNAKIILCNSNPNWEGIKINISGLSRSYFPGETPDNEYKNAPLSPKTGDMEIIIILMVVILTSGIVIVSKKQSNRR